MKLPVSNEERYRGRQSFISETTALCCQVSEFGEFWTYDKKESEKVALFILHDLLFQRQIGTMVLLTQIHRTLIDALLSTGAVKSEYYFTGPGTGSSLVHLVVDPRGVWEL